MFAFVEQCQEDVWAVFLLWMRCACTAKAILTRTLMDGRCMDDVTVVLLRIRRAALGRSINDGALAQDEDDDDDESVFE
jgi:hypothetical protein